MTLADEVRALRGAVAESQLRTVDLIQQWIDGLEQGVPQSVVVAAMKQATHDLRREALKP